MTREEDGFLGRWSRLKRARTQPAIVAPVPDIEVGSAPEALPDPQPQPEVETLSAEELAALPRIEDLNEGSDIRAFLRAGVPRHLRNAALRRMWMLTPAIRDYRDPAVDYAWDWNSPGGVPGDGAGPSAERAAEMLRDILVPKERAEHPDVAQDHQMTSDKQGPEPTAASDIRPSSAQLEDIGTLDALQDTDGKAADGDPARRRRHGSAVPG